MFWQREKYRSAAVLPVGGEFVLTLPSNGFLSAIKMHIYKGGVTDSMIAIEKWRMLDWISSIKVQAPGGDILKNLTGRLAHASAWYDGGLGSPDKQFNYGSSTKRFHNSLNFGRWPFDYDYGLDLSRYGAIDLRVANDATTSQFATDLAIDVSFLWLREAPANQFKGYIRSEEYIKWLTTASEHRYVDLPTQGMLRRLLFQVDPTVDAQKNANRTLYQTLSNVKMTTRSGAQTIIDTIPRDLWYDYGDMNGRDLIQTMEPYHSNTYGVRTGLGQTLGEAGARLPQSGTQNTYGMGIWPGDDGPTLRRSASADTTQDALLAVGLGIENTFPLVFDPYGDTSNLIDLKNEKQVSLDLSVGTDSNDTSATIRIQMDRMYPLG